MADNPRDPKDSGKIGLPKIDAGMNRLGPTSKNDYDDPKRLGANDSEKSDRKDDEILERLRKRFERCESAEGDNRRRQMAALEFYSGKQWSDAEATARNIDQRPCLTINRLQVLVRQVTNDQRMNRPAINVSPVGDKGDPEAAKMYRGLIRAGERKCNADIAYDTAFHSAVSAGIGYIRIFIEWESEDSFNQTFVVKRVRNPFTIYGDPDSQEPDGADWRYAFATEIIPLDEFKLKYPDADITNFDMGGQGEKFKSWFTKDGVRIAEYYEIEKKPYTLVKLDNGHEGDEGDLNDIIKQKIKTGSIKVIEERESFKRKIMWYKVTATQIIDREEWVGKWIPIIPVIGNEIDVGGKTQISGLVEPAMDPQRMYNYYKPLALDTPIPTPSGWTTMGDVKPGDEVFDERGFPVAVVGESPVHLHRDCYRVTFDDGESIVADGEHPWSVEYAEGRTAAGTVWKDKVVSTEQLSPSDRIWLAFPVELPEADLPINPYLLGAWLGDGFSQGPALCAGEEDVDHLRFRLEISGHNLGETKRYGGNCPQFSVLGVRRHFTKLNLLGNKHIPPVYLRASWGQRHALLQGLMDTDGSISKTGNQCAFVTTSPALAEGFAELIRTLGYKAVRCETAAYERRVANAETVSQCAASTHFSFTAYPHDGIFTLPRKRALLDRPRAAHRRRTKRFRIRSVERVASVPVKCIAVDSPNHLFLAGRGMVPTHNTKEAEAVALAPLAPYIMTEGQAEGHEDEWRNANRKANPVLFYKPETIGGRPAPPPQRQPMAGIPEGFTHGAEGASMDVMAVTGIRFDVQSDHRNVDDRSGRAIREFNKPQALGTSHYMDNLKRSLMQVGNQLADIIPKIYTEKQVVTILREDDTEQKVEINPHAPEAHSERATKDGKVSVFNPNIGKYGITVTIGPSWATKRIEAGDSMLELVKAVPEIGKMIPDLIVKNMDWDGAQEMADRLAKAIPPNLMTPDQKDMSPQMQAYIQNLEGQLKQLNGQLQQAMHALNDKGADRAIAQDKIDKDYEAKILGIIEKGQANQAKAVAEQVRTFMDAVKSDGARADTKEAAAVAASQPEVKPNA